jgi:hypothetical protein
MLDQNRLAPSMRGLAFTENSASSQCLRLLMWPTSLYLTRRPRISKIRVALWIAPTLSVAPALSILFRDSAAIRNNLIKSRTEYFFPSGFGFFIVFNVSTDQPIELARRRRRIDAAEPQPAGRGEAELSADLCDVGPRSGRDAQQRVRDLTARAALDR